MPQMGVSVSEGTITKWLKQRASTIEADEPLLEISTDKVDTEVPSPAPGRAQILVAEGETVDVGTRLAVIGGEARRRRRGAAGARPEPAPAAQRGRGRVERGGDRAAAPRHRRPPRRPQRRARPATAASNGKSFVSPVVARIASEHGVDVSSVQGTGRGGRVTKKDILAFVESGALGAAAPPAPRRATAPAPPHRRLPRRPRLRRRLPPRQPPAPPTAAAASPRADDRHAPGHRRAHAPLARHLRARDQRDRGRHVEGRRDPQEAEARVPAGLRRQPDVPRVRRAGDRRDAARLPVDQRRAARRPDRDAQLREPRYRGRARGRQGPDRPRAQERRGAEPARHRARRSPTSPRERATRSCCPTTSRAARSRSRTRAATARSTARR